ncbi:MAG: hypothetical protein V3S01_01920 [Dehalococcoidia bacterium]
MNHGARSLIYVCAVGLVVGGAGCSGKTYRVGRKAESRGEVHVAYDKYRLAAREHPGSGAVASGIKRTGPSAAGFWESQARAAMEEGRFTDAWRMWMRVLEISPNHYEAPGIIRQLHSQHASEIADARADWLRRGSASLALAEPRRVMAQADAGDEAASDAGTIITAADSGEMVATGPRLARASSESSAGSEAVVEGDASPLEGEPIEVVAMAPGSAHAEPDRPVLRVATPPEEEEDVDPGAATPSVAEAEPVPEDRPARPPPRTEIKEDPPSSAKPARPVRPEPRVEPAQATAEAGSKTGQDPQGATSERSPPTVAARTRGERPDDPAYPRRSSEQGRVVWRLQERSGRPGEFAVIRTLSKRDRRYPRQASLIDGVTVQLKDTDGDLDADLNLFEGEQRIGKIRELPVGRSQSFRSTSGKQYRLTILGVHHRTRTVRIGIKPV